MSDFEAVPTGALERLNRIERVNREQAELLDRIYQYVDERGLAKLGQSRVKALIEAHRQVVAERDALAAHVERLHMAWVDAKRCVSVVAFPALYRVEQYQHLAKRSIEKLESVVSDTPTTSLARLKTKWQADEDRLNWLEHQTRKSRTGISFDWVPTCGGEPSGFRFMRFHHVGTPVKTLRGAIDRELRQQSEESRDD